MTIEEKLKKTIIFQYGSLRAFTMQKNLTYANVDSILRRGIKNATWTSVKALCAALGISADELANEKIKPVTDALNSVNDLDQIIQITKTNLNDNDLTVEGKPLTRNEVEMFLDGIDLTIELIKRNRRRNEEQ